MSGLGMVDEDGMSHDEFASPPMSMQPINNGQQYNNTNNSSYQKSTPYDQRPQGAYPQYPNNRPDYEQHVARNAMGFPSAKSSKRSQGSGGMKGMNYNNMQNGYNNGNPRQFNNMPNNGFSNNRQMPPNRMPSYPNGYNQNGNSSRRRQPQPQIGYSEENAEDEMQPVDFFPAEVARSQKRKSRSRSSKVTKKNKPAPLYESDSDLGSLDSDSDSNEQLVSAVSKKQKQKMDKNRTMYNLETVINSLKVEFSAIQHSTNAAITAMQQNLQNMNERIKELQNNSQNLQQEDVETITDHVMDNMQKLMIDLKDSTKWFWGKVLDNEKGYVELYQYPPSEHNKKRGDVLKMKCGRWLRLSYPTIKGMDYSGKEFIWVRTESIDPITASITTWWIKCYDCQTNLHLLGEYRYRSPTNDPVPNHTEPESKEMSTGKSTNTKMLNESMPAPIPAKKENKYAQPYQIKPNVPGKYNHTQSIADKQKRVQQLERELGELQSQPVAYVQSPIEQENYGDQTNVLDSVNLEYSE